ncbi:hypothetical protein [Methylocystis echinoides]|jgi:hypothetical protein|uniref:hypothetical protein n=1 Tax=Methylocystis echinoides TaxID=29468 RepID=UPI00341F4F6F
MGIKKPPSGRSCALAQAALATLKTREKQERSIVVASGATLGPLGLWRDVQGGAIRLIDLERRARFPRVAS